MQTKVGIGLYSAGEEPEQNFIAVSVLEDGEMELMTSGDFKPDGSTREYLFGYLISVNKAHGEADYHLNYFFENGKVINPEFLESILFLPYKIKIKKVDFIDLGETNPSYISLKEKYPFYYNLNKKELNAAWLSFKSNINY